MAKNNGCYIVVCIDEPRYGIGRTDKHIDGVYRHLDKAVARAQHMYDLVSAHCGDPDYNIKLLQNGECFGRKWVSSWCCGDRYISYEVISYYYKD